MRTLAIGLAGSAGALARVGVSLWLAGAIPSAFPLGVLLVNLTGSFLLGLLTRVSLEARVMPEWLQTALAVGFFGGYTTFSAWAVDSVLLWEQGQALLALLNSTLPLALGFAAATLGYSEGWVRALQEDDDDGPIIATEQGNPGD